MSATTASATFFSSGSDCETPKAAANAVSLPSTPMPTSIGPGPVVDGGPVPPLPAPTSAALPATGPAPAEGTPAAAEVPTAVPDVPGAPRLPAADGPATL